MIITKEGFWKLEEGEFEITSNAIMSTLVCHWLVAKQHSVDDLRQKGLNWYHEIGESVEPREFFNYVYINETVRDGSSSPPSRYWRRQAEGRLEEWEKCGRKKEWKFFQMHKVLEKHGWSPAPEKSRRGSIKKAAEELGWSRQTLYNRIRKCPKPPEPPWEQQFARMILDYYYKMRDRIGDFWFWKASHLLPPEYSENYIPQVSMDDFIKHNRERKELDFSILDQMYKEFSKLKLVQYGGWGRWMVITKGEIKVADLREPPWRGTTFIDKVRYELTGELPQQNKSKEAR